MRWDKAAYGKSVVRLLYHNGNCEVSRHEVKSWRDQTSRLMFGHRDWPGVGHFQGVKYRCLWQFRFYPPCSAEMLVPENYFGDHSIEWFMRRVNRLKRKGIMTESTEKKDRVELHVVHTSCKDCVFAEYAGKTQTGCAFNNRVGKFLADGCVLEAADEEKEFYLINGRQCVAFRGPDWGRRHKPSEWVDVARRELTVRVDFVVPVDGEMSDESLAATLESLKAQTMTPSSVTVVCNAEGVSLGKMSAKLTRMAGGLNWFVTDIQERTGGGARVHRARAVDLAVSRLKGHFYTVVEPGSTLPPSFTADLDRAVTDEMARFAVLLPNGRGQGATVALGFHRAPMVNGNRATPATVLLEDDDPDRIGNAMMLNTVEQKACFIAQYHQLPHLVANVGDVCKALS